MIEETRRFPSSLVSALQEAQRVVALTGSGISAESGVSTFRKARTGLWARYEPQELATLEAFRRDPRLVWEWYAWRRALVEKARPNPGHLALARLESLVPSFTLVTQNVDGLHKRAGSTSVLELHGNIRRSKCSVEDVIVETPETDEAPPPCPRCGAPLRPDVVWFGEALPQEAVSRASQAVRECELLFSIGTSGAVYPAASLPYKALTNGATVIEVNAEETSLTAHATYSLRGLAGELLPELVETTFG